MKTNKYILGAGLWAMALTGCTNLEVDVNSQYTQYPDNPIVVEAKMADVYFHLRTTLGRRYMEAQAVSSDEYTCLAFDGGYYDGGTYAHQALHCSTDEDASLDWYSDVSAGVTKANKVIKELGGNEAGEKVAPARAMRAFFTFILMENFGDTPILETVPQDGEEVVRAPRKEVAEWLEKELKAVIPDLTTEVSSNTYGKPTRWMASALLAKLYLNWAVYTADKVDAYEAATAKNPKLADCIQVCDEIIRSGKFNLGSMEYRFKFAPDNGPQVEDFIYAMPFDAITQPGLIYARPRTFRDMKNMLPNYYGSSEKFTQSFGGNLVLTPEMASLFSLPGDQRNLVVLGGPVYIYNAKTLLPTNEPFIYNGSQLVFTKDITLVKTDNTVDVGNDAKAKSQGYHSIKFFTIPSDYNNGRNQSNDLPIFRYADILLTKAEALVRQGNTGEEARSLFNEVRDYAKAPLLETNPTLQDILDERGREFLDENWRRNDMIRFGTYEGQFFPHYTGFPDANFDKKHRIFPVPKSVLNLYPNWTQNAGY